MLEMLEEEVSIQHETTLDKKLIHDRNEIGGSALLFKQLLLRNILIRLIFATF